MKSKKGTESVGSWHLLWWPAGLGWPHSRIWLLANHWEGFRGHRAIGLSCTWPSCPSLPHDHGKFPRGQRPRLGVATLSLPTHNTGQSKPQASPDSQNFHGWEIPDISSWWKESQSQIIRSTLWPFFAIYHTGLFQKLWLKIWITCQIANAWLELPWGTFQGDELLALEGNTSLNLSWYCLSGSKSSSNKYPIILFFLLGGKE